MKSFDRFAHQGVTQELLRLKEFTSAFGDFKYGSSGDGEITIQGLNATVYARKYKTKSGWRLVTYKSGKETETFPPTTEAVLEHIRNEFR